MKKNRKTDLEELVLKAKEDDEEAIEILLYRFKPYIIKKASSIYLKGYEMEDLIQIGYVYVINAIKKYKINSNCFTSYAIRAINNGLNYEIRKRINENYEGSLQFEIGEKFTLMDIIPSTEDIENDYLNKEKREMIKEYLKFLPDYYENILEEIFLNELSLKEYSEKYGIKYTTCVKRKSRALKRLRKYLVENNEFKN